MRTSIGRRKCRGHLRKKATPISGGHPRTPLDTENSSGRHASERGAGLGVLIPRHAVFNIKHVSREGI
jgi:hypothetical protein